MKKFSKLDVLNFLCALIANGILFDHQVFPLLGISSSDPFYSEFIDKLSNSGIIAISSDERLKSFFVIGPVLRGELDKLALMVGNILNNA